MYREHFKEINTANIFVKPNKQITPCTNSKVTAKGNKNGKLCRTSVIAVCELRTVRSFAFEM